MDLVHVPVHRPVAMLGGTNTQNGRINKDNGNISSSQLPSTRRRHYPVVRLLHHLALLYY